MGEPRCNSPLPPPRGSVRSLAAVARNGNSRGTWETDPLKIKGVGQLRCQSLIRLAVSRVAGCSPHVIHQEEIVAGAEDVVEPELDPEKGVGVVVANNGRGQQLIVEGIFDAGVHNVV